MCQCLEILDEGIIWRGTPCFHLVVYNLAILSSYFDWLCCFYAIIITQTKLLELFSRLIPAENKIFGKFLDGFNTGRWFLMFYKNDWNSVVDCFKQNSLETEMRLKVSLPTKCIYSLKCSYCRFFWIGNYLVVVNLVFYFFIEALLNAQGTSSYHLVWLESPEPLDFK